MLELALHSAHLDQAYLGKITWRKPWFRAKDYILVAPDALKPSYALLTLSSQQEAENKQGMAYMPLEQLQQLKEGDIVLIEPTTLSKDSNVASNADHGHGNDNKSRADDAQQIAQGHQGHVVVLLETESNSNYLVLTERCNHRCIMCPQPPVKQENNRLQHNLRLIELMSKDIKTIGITGGEPTLAGDDLITILKAINKRAPQASITILTNAVKLADRDFAYKIACCNCQDLQIDVPLFASIPELHNEIVGSKTFYKTIQGIYNLATFNLDIGIRVVIHRLNYQHLKALSYFIYHNLPFVKQVAFMQMETIGYAEDNIQRLWIDPFDYKDELSEAVNFLRLRRINTLIYNAQLCVLTPDVRDVAIQSISEWKNIYLDTCQQCDHKAQCPGFFASNAKYHSTHIHALVATEN